MDIEAEYAKAYGGVPRPDQSWHGVLALLARAGRFENRQLLQIINGTVMGQPVGEAHFGQRMLQIAGIERKAYVSEDAHGA